MLNVMRVIIQRCPGNSHMLTAFEKALAITHAIQNASLRGYQQHTRVCISGILKIYITSFFQHNLHIIKYIL